jgi:hypothetical protein
VVHATSQDVIPRSRLVLSHRSPAFLTTTMPTAPQFHPPSGGSSSQLDTGAIALADCALTRCAIIRGLLVCLAT